MNRRSFLKSAAALAVGSAFPLPVPTPAPLLRGQLGVVEGFTFIESTPSGVNTICALTPALYEALDIISREMVGLIPSMERYR